MSCFEHIKIEIPISQSSWRCLSSRQLDIGVWSLTEEFMDGNINSRDINIQIILEALGLNEIH